METASATGAPSTVGLYSPLDSSRRQIRVLEVLPVKVKSRNLGTAFASFNNDHNEDEKDDDYAGPISAELRTVSLLDKPHYTAISYTWGDPLKEEKLFALPEETASPNVAPNIESTSKGNGDRHYILLNGRHFEVRPNLHDCLIHLWRVFRKSLREQDEGVKLGEKKPFNINDRSAGGSETSSTTLGYPPIVYNTHEGETKPRLVLWVDAICINQDDIPERNDQVLLMGDIYRNATSVISWLGSDPRIVRAFEMGLELANCWYYFRRAVMWKYEWETSGKEDDKQQDVEQQQGATLEEGQQEPENKKEDESDRVRKRDKSSESTSQRTINIATTATPIRPNAFRGELRKLFLRRTKMFWTSRWFLDHLTNLFQFEYWKRVWIAQEVVLANRNSHVFMSGKQAASEGDILELVMCLMELSKPLVEPTGRGNDLSEDGFDIWSTTTEMRFRFLCNLYPLLDLLTIRIKLRAQSFTYVLSLSDARYCSDPHDVVYGMLSMLPPNHGIKPDYSQPVRDAYMDWTLRTMRELGNFELLGWAGTGFYARRPESITPLNLPSWVPDLYNHKGLRNVHGAMPQKSIYNIPSSFSVTDDSLTAENMPFSLTVTPSGGLKVRALRRATIRWKYQIPDSCGSHIAGQHFANFCIEYLLDLQERGKSHPSGLPPLQALFRMTYEPVIFGLETEEKETAIHRMAGCFVCFLLHYIGEKYAFDDQHGRFTKEECEIRAIEAQRIALEAMRLDSTNFPEAYRQAFFPDVDIEKVMGWSKLQDVMENARSLSSTIILEVAAFGNAKRLFATEEGYAGWGPDNTQPGDGIYEIEHCSKMIVFRQRDSDSVPSNIVELLGACYVVGLGDEFDKCREGEYQEFVII